jgi:hypothetical protein
MATRKSKIKADEGPVITKGSHSTTTTYPNGRVEFVTHWDELVRDVQEAIASVENQPAPKKRMFTKKGKENGNK